MLKLANQIEWSWMWVLAPLWIVVGLKIGAVALFMAGRVFVGSDRTLDLYDKTIVGLTFVGVGGFTTVVLGALKLAGAITLSWSVILAPVKELVDLCE